MPKSFEEDNLKTMSVRDLVARCTTESFHASIILSICEEWHDDNTHSLQKLGTETYGA